MSSRVVTIIATGVANTASVAAALRRCGASVEITDDAAQVARSTRLVLPGVGSFAAGIASLRERGLDQTIRERVREQMPLLAICLGLQLLCRASDESPGVEGLAVIDDDIRRFPDSVRVPQFGWNRVEISDACRLVQPGHAYFANSYRLARPPAGWASATADHGGAFVAAFERGSILACQFHPELSGAWGLALLSRWLERAGGGDAC